MSMINIYNVAANVQSHMSREFDFFGAVIRPSHQLHCLIFNASALIILFDAET